MRHPLAFALLLFAFFSTAMAQDSKSSPAKSSKTLSSEKGRFVLGQISDFRSDQYLLDTETGRVWSIGVTRTGEQGKDSEIKVFQPVLFITPEGKFSIEPK
jgi:hypothetical protein